MPLMSDIEPFLPGTVPFSQHLEQLDWIFSHHKITDPEEKKITFLASCNTEVFSELKLLFPDRDLKRVTFSEICHALCRRYDKSESVLRRRYKFYRREQGSSESAEDFIRAVKQLADRCEFGSFKPMAVRDRLVCGILDRDLQKRLLEKDDPTLSETEQLILEEDILGTRREGHLTRNDGGDRYRHRRSKDKYHVVNDRSISRDRSRRSRSRNRSKSPLSRLEPEADRKTLLRCTFCGRDGHTVKYCFDKRSSDKPNKNVSPWESKRSYSNSGRDPFY